MHPSRAINADTFYSTSVRPEASGITRPSGAPITSESRQAITGGAASPALSKAAGAPVTKPITTLSRDPHPTDPVIGRDSRSPTSPDGPAASLSDALDDSNHGRARRSTGGSSVGLVRAVVELPRRMASRSTASPAGSALPPPPPPPPPSGSAAPSLYPSMIHSGTEYPLSAALIASALASAAASGTSSSSSSKRKADANGDTDTSSAELKRLKTVVQFPHTAVGGAANAAALAYTGSAVHPSPQDYDVQTIRAAVPLEKTPVVELSEQPAPVAEKERRRGPSSKKAAAAPVAEMTDDDLNKLNNDYCDSCLGTGLFICCEGCPRAFHFYCADPPIDPENIPDDAWYCTSCRAERFPNSFRKHAGAYGRLLDAVAHTNTTVFLLPEWIRTYYEGINTDPLNGNFRDDADRKGKFKKGAWVPEDDPTAGANATALAAAAAGNGAAHGHCCYKCAGSSSSRASMLLVCDYCRTAWHMDCLDEPPTIPPGHTQKWRCPLHPESMVPGINKRIPRLGRTKPTDFVIYGPSDECDEANFAIEFDEDTDKRRRYVLPEHSIVLDFVRAVEGGAREEAQRASRRLPIKVDVPEDIRKAYDRAEADMSADRPTDSDVRLFAQSVWGMASEASKVDAGTWVPSDEYRKFVEWRDAQAAAAQ